MITVLGDLLADYSMRLPFLCIEPQDLHRVSYLALGPGGAGNVAIMAAHLGLSVAALGEVGEDRFGQIVRAGLAAEGVNTDYLVSTPETQTPVATVLVDERGEPAYLGYPGNLTLGELPAPWRSQLTAASAHYSDGWAEHEGIIALVLAGFEAASAAGVPIFFDPGPGNPALDNGWHRTAARMATVLLATEAEAERMSGLSDPVASARALLTEKDQLVIVKRGVAGCMLVTASELEIVPGFPVEAVDATGAGDSFAAATIYGYLAGLSLRALGKLANATGAAKVQKLGTGHSMPSTAEVLALLERFGEDGDSFQLNLAPQEEKTG